MRLSALTGTLMVQQPENEPLGERWLSIFIENGSFIRIDPHKTLLEMKINQRREGLKTMV